MSNFVQKQKSEMMKIGFDGKRAVSNLTGLGNYSRLVIESLAESYPEMSLTLFCPHAPGSNPRLKKILDAHNVTFRMPQKGEAPLGGSVWRTFGISRALQKEGINLFHGLSNELPLNIRNSGIPSIVTMHDVIYRRLPYCYKTIDRKIYDWKYGASCRNATHIVAVSERTKLDVMYYYKIPEERISVIYQGCDPQFYSHLPEAKIAEISRKYSLPERYIIQVGTIERRKNAMLTVKALAALPATIHLVLIGRSTTYYKQVEEEARRLGVASRILHLEGLPFIDLPALYQGAEVAVYPSYYEGFGIPVLEAIAGGTPCIAATGSCLEEAGGDGALYVDPDDPRELADSLNSLINDPDLRTVIRGRGLIHAARFDNSSIATRLHALYEKFGKDL